MPGTQPGQVANLESDKQCLSCHGGFEMDRWKGSMMGQAARDPLFWAALTVTAQDGIWALGNPNAADICIRCHFPQGWLEGRSDPVNATLMRGEDYDGVNCKICHYLYDPHFTDTFSGVREGNDWSGYWDETDASNTPSQAAAAATLAADNAAAALLKFFNGENFYTNGQPVSTAYTENGGGHMFLATDDPTTGARKTKRGPMADAVGKHEQLYSRYHKSKYMCGTCHDISNPVLENLAHAGTQPGDGVTMLPSESKPAYSYGHVERTFSEFMLSAFGRTGGAVGSGPYDPAVFATSRPGNRIATCQDCHFRDLPGQKAANSGLVRPAESTEHPRSGVPEHRMVGGNAWIPFILASIEPTSPNYDPVNEALLKQGPAALTLDFTQGEPLNPSMLLETVTSAHQMLQNSASISHAGYDLNQHQFTLRLVNHTGHKLISGYPDGRRMFLNIKAYANNQLITEINPYDNEVGTLKGLANSLGSPRLADGERYVDELVYEVHLGSSLLGVTETFHIALATERYKDNRILPRGFQIADAATRLSQPVWHGVSDQDHHDPGNYFTPAEYEGGYDEITVTLPPGTERIEAGLYYQTTSREFIEFLRDEINGVNPTLAGIGAGGDPPYIAQTDAWFSGLAAWGDTIWQLWEHNKNVPGAAPILMRNTVVQLDVTDEDGDGIPAYWEQLHFGGTTNAIAGDDPDNDGVNNLGEYLAFTLPLDSDSVFTIGAQITPLQTGAELVVTFPSTRARNYTLEQRTNLASPFPWVNASPKFPGNDSVQQLVHTNTAPAGFYRVNVEPR